MEIPRAYKTALKTNNKQAAWLTQCADTARFVYNWGLAEWNAWFFQYGIRPISAVRLKTFFNQMIKDDECPWVRDYPYGITESAFINLGRAFDNFWRQRKDGTVAKRIKALGAERWNRRVAKALERGWPVMTVEPGYPKFKRKEDSRRSFQIRQFSIESSHVLGRRRDVRAIGPLRLWERNYIPVGAKYGTYATFSRRAGRWFISVLTKEEIPDPVNTSTLAVGVDVGITALAVCSDGTVYENPRPLKQAEARLARLARELSRRRGGKNWHKTKDKLARQHARIANIRQSTRHQISHDIVVNKRPGVIVLENLNVPGMLKNHSLAQAIADSGFAELRRQIEYKARWRGVEIIIADRWYPSSKRCHVCGAIKEDLSLSDRTWKCDACGTILERDLNAAKNLAALVNREARGDGPGIESDSRPELGT